jgi:hypothetical protein
VKNPTFWGFFTAIFDDLLPLNGPGRGSKKMTKIMEKRWVFETPQENIIKGKGVKDMKSTITKLAGVTFADAQENIKRFGCRDIGSYRLLREPDNPHDPNAIRVELAGLFLGYIPRDLARKLAPLMDAGMSFLALFVSRNESPFHETVGLTVEVVEAPTELSAAVLKEEEQWHGRV